MSENWIPVNVVNFAADIIAAILGVGRIRLVATGITISAVLTPIGL